MTQGMPKIRAMVREHRAVIVQNAVPNEVSAAGKGPTGSVRFTMHMRCM